MTAPSALRWIVGCVGLLVALGLGRSCSPDAFAFAWLCGVMIWLRWPLGCLALLLVHALTGGRWGISIRPSLRAGHRHAAAAAAGACAGPAAACRTLYPWARPARIWTTGSTSTCRSSLPRWVVYLVVWFGSAAGRVRACRAGDALDTIAAPG